MARLDPHSYNDNSQPEATQLDWTARVDFKTRRLEAQATLRFAAPVTTSGPLDLDTRGLEIGAVQELSTGQSLAHELHPEEPVLGSRLRIELPAGGTGVVVRYRTSPDASALQWLAPAQTRGGEAPFLFSQCQAIHARSVVPLQDTPRLRIRYRAELTVPRALRAVMAAAFDNRTEEGDWATERYHMPQPIPPYLLAFAVGQLASRDLSPRCRVWAEPSLIDAAAHEFAEVEKMIAAAEALFGPYEWDRFDILTMPPSFPYGGMENPRLTFLTPTLLAKDRSLVNVLAHELAHSWTGNLVTNANAEHFWLNEGFTVFAERRILEALEGPEVCALHAAIGRKSLDEAMQRFEKAPELTRLRTRLSGVDPDEAFSQVPYEKGYLFLRTLEEAVGRTSFDQFLRGYLNRFRFGSITTDDFLALVEETLPGALKAVKASAWLNEPGIPSNAPAPRSSRLDEVQALKTAIPSEEQATRWTPTEWQLYLDLYPRPAAHAACQELDQRFGLGRSQNYEVLCSWLVLAANSGYAPAIPRVREVLGEVGRMKFLRPLYQALAQHPDTLPVARECFARFSPGYHPIARQVIEGVLRLHQQ